MCEYTPGLTLVLLNEVHNDWVLHNHLNKFPFVQRMLKRKGLFYTGLDTGQGGWDVNNGILKGVLLFDGRRGNEGRGD